MACPLSVGRERETVIPYGKRLGGLRSAGLHAAAPFWGGMTVTPEQNQPEQAQTDQAAAPAPQVEPQADPKPELSEAEMQSVAGGVRGQQIAIP